MDIMAMTAQLAEGFLVTVQIFVLTLLFSLPLGMLVAFGRISRCKIIKLIAKLYISVMRGTPLMLQIIVVYFAPYYMFRMKMGPGYRFPAVIIAFVINYAAYFCRNLSFWYRIHAKWTVRGSTGAWLQQSADFHSHYSAAGN